MLETQRICKLHVNSLTFPSICHSILLKAKSLPFATRLMVWPFDFLA